MQEESLARPAWMERLAAPISQSWLPDPHGPGWVFAPRQTDIDTSTCAETAAAHDIEAQAAILRNYAWERRYSERNAPRLDAGRSPQDGQLAKNARESARSLLSDAEKLRIVRSGSPARRLDAAQTRQPHTERTQPVPLLISSPSSMSSLSLTDSSESNPGKTSFVNSPDVPEASVCAQLFFLHTYVCSPCATCDVNGRGEIPLAKRSDSVAPIARQPSGSGARAGRTLCFRALACAPKRSNGVRWRLSKHWRAAAERRFRGCTARTSGASRPT